jgi:Domain of unknown function (DUF4276)
MEIRIYFEGKVALRGGFESFFAELRTTARKSGSTVKLIAAKDGPSLYRKAERTHPEAWNILLQDSEGPAPTQPQKDVFWMVELMEAWFLADPDSLADYYARGFRPNAVGDAVDVERVPKAEVLDRLRRATTKTSKGEYHKVRHAPFLLEKLDPHKVQTRAQHCRQLFEAVMARLT